jgi:uncharacterized protein YdbL (DUF1318 family)
MRFAALALLVAAFAPVAAAQEVPAIATARGAGGVGERFDGYLGIAGPVSPAVRQQVNSVNIKRRALYSNLAQRNRVAPEDVGVTAGCSLLARVRVGEAYLLQDGRWRRREAGEAPRVPDYCRP